MDSKFINLLGSDKLEIDFFALIIFKEGTVLYLGL